jgi:hypothetical protein
MGDMYLLSIPKMIHGVEPYVEIFHTAVETRSDADTDSGAPETP